MERFVEIVKEHFTEEQIESIVEVGALDGADAEYFKLCFPNADVVAYEGLRENWENNAPSGVEWHNMVISSVDGEVTYYVKITNGIHGIFDRGSQYGEETRVVPCYRLDTITWSPIDMMKIDVEGATYEVLIGMGFLLDAVKIMHIETEDVHYFAGQKLHKEVEELLEERGFKCIDIQGARINSGQQYDSVWIKK